LAKPCRVKALLALADQLEVRLARRAGKWKSAVEKEIVRRK
jgi:hypothetical protein